MLDPAGTQRALCLRERPLRMSTVCVCPALLALRGGLCVLRGEGDAECTPQSGHAALHSPRHPSPPQWPPWKRSTTRSLEALRGEAQHKPFVHKEKHRGCKEADRESRPGQSLASCTRGTPGKATGWNGRLQGRHVFANRDVQSARQGNPRLQS